MPKTRVLIADSNPSVAQGLAAVLREVPDLAVVGYATSVPSAGSMADEFQPEVVVIDADLGMANCSELLDALHEQRVAPSVIFLTSEDDLGAAETALGHGATEYVRREASTDELVAAIRWAHVGETWGATQGLGDNGPISLAASPSTPLRELTQREQEILGLLMEGTGLRHIAERLDLSLNTVRTHTRNIHMKLNVHSNLEAVLVALAGGARPS